MADDELPGDELSAAEFPSRSAREHRDYGSRSQRWIQLHDAKSYELASPSSRLMARIIDSLVLLVAAFVISLAFSVDLLGSDAVDGGAADAGNVFWFTLILTAVGLIYEVTLIAVRGQTLGKQLFGAKVVRIEDAKVPGGKKSFVRWVVPAVLGLIPFVGGMLALVGYMFLLWDNQRQNWYDKAAGTAVIKVPRPERKSVL